MERMAESAVTSPGARAPETSPRAVWSLAIGVSVALAVVFRLSAWHGAEGPTLPAYTWAPAAAVAILVYLWLARVRLRATGPRDGGATAPGAAQVAWAAVAIAAFAAYARVVSPPRIGDLALLSAIHLPALAWLVAGAAVLGGARDPDEWFAGLVKSVEILVTGALYAGVAGVFSLVTFGLFAALQVEMPRPVAETFPTLLPGLIPVLAVASVFDPGLRPAAQRFGAGLTRLFFIAARLFLPLTLLVLLVVAAVMPARFAVLAGNRETLVVFNAMLFAVMLLLVGASPVRGAAAAPAAPGLESWLRRGILATAVLTAVVGGFALAAILSRTGLGGLTANRLTVIGWNVVNLVALAILVVSQLRAGRTGWVPALHRAFGAGLALYAIWTVFVLLALPLIARAAGWPTAPGGLFH